MERRSGCGWSDNSATKWRNTSCALSWSEAFPPLREEKEGIGKIRDTNGMPGSDRSGSPGNREGDLDRGAPSLSALDFYSAAIGFQILPDHDEPQTDTALLGRKERLE